MAGGDATAVEINTTWVSSALKCLLSDWNCAFFADSVSSEKVIYQHLFYDVISYLCFRQNNIREALGYSVYMSDGVSFYSKSGNPLFPPSYYADVLSPYSRQPIVNHNGRLYGKYSEKWNEKDDIMYSTPNILEAIIRTTMSYYLGEKDALHFLSIVIGTGESGGVVKDSASAAAHIDESTTLDTTVPEGEQRLYCSVSSDCDEYFCEFFSFEIPMVKLECLMGVCVCPVASYHVALDPGNSVVVTSNSFVLNAYFAQG